MKHTTDSEQNIDNAVPEGIIAGEHQGTEAPEAGLPATGAPESQGGEPEELEEVEAEESEELVPEPEASPQPQAEAELELEGETEVEAPADPQSEAAIEAETGLQVEPKTEPKTEPKIEPKIEPEPTPTPETKSKSKSKSKPKGKSKGKSKSKSKGGPQGERKKREDSGPGPGAEPVRPNYTQYPQLGVKSGMLAHPKRLAGLLFTYVFDHLSYGEKYVDKIREVSSTSQVVWVGRRPSLIDYLAMNSVLRRASLPLCQFANSIATWHLKGAGSIYQGVKRFFAGLPPPGFTQKGKAARQNSVKERRKASALDLRKTISVNEPAMVYMGHRKPRASLLGESTSKRNRSRDAFIKQNQDVLALFVELVDMARSGQSIHVVPHSILWERRPVKDRIRLADLLIGDVATVGRMGRLLEAFFTVKRAILRIAEPIDVGEFVKRHSQFDNEIIARRLRAAVSVQLTRQFRMVCGPRQIPTHRVKEKVLNSPKVVAVIDELAAQGKQSRGELRKLAHTHVNTIASDFTLNMVRILSWVLQFVWNKIYDGIDDSFKEGLEKVSRAAGRGPVVLVPTHRSHADYLILSYMMYKQGLLPPHIAAGANLSFWPLGVIFRKSGAFFIRRTIRGDVLYSAVLSSYVHQLVKEGFNLEFFIEGGRSRTGKVLPPKFGILSMIAEAFKYPDAPRLSFVPVAVGYERIIEAGSYIEEQQGKPKQKEDIRGLLSVRKVLARRHGRVHIQFGDPIDGKKFFSTVTDTGVDFQTPQGEQLFKEQVSRLGYVISERMGQIITVTPISLLALVLLTQPKRGIALEDLKVKVGFLVALFKVNGAKLSSILEFDHLQLPRGEEGGGGGGVGVGVGGGGESAGSDREPDFARALGEGPFALKVGAAGGEAPFSHRCGDALWQVMETAMELLFKDEEVVAHEAVGETVYQPHDTHRLFLDYHRNMLINLIAKETVMATLVMSFGEREIRMASLEERFGELIELLKREFAFPPDGVADGSYFYASLESLWKQKLLEIRGDGGELISAPEELGADLGGEAVVVIPSRAISALKFWREATRPSLEAYWVMADTLAMLPANSVHGEHELLEQVQNRGALLFAKEAITLPESSTRLALRQALSLCIEWQVIQVVGERGPGAGRRLLILPEKARPIADRISRFFSTE